ncbi:MAG: D-Ala-D-Ala carboxypeptidase family metallohydrolase [Cetobacterium sp.]|uniref:D-Ala-D-Ala carboxypeptidase family metallohydrolase n=1 Tax=Cetobacterium sp. TaxID=2071632 RepID=UPI003F344D5A
MTMCNFIYKEVIGSETADRLSIDNSVDRKHMDNVMKALCGIQLVRWVLDSPVKVTSWYRCEELNKAVGGSTTSKHKEGFAIDFIPIGCDLHTAYKKIKDEPQIMFNQLIIYPSRGFIHIDFSSNNRQLLTK